VRTLIVLALGCLLVDGAARAAELVDGTPRIAVMSAFEPEWTTLRAAMTDRHEQVVNGRTFVMGSLEGQDAVLFLSGISMVNAAMTTQLALDRFQISRIVFSGIAGGVDPAFAIGDVVVPSQWGEYLEAVFARETAAGWRLPSFFDRPFPNYGMIFPQPVEVARAGAMVPEQRFWFPVDAAMLAVAREVEHTVKLATCTTDNHCFERPPRVAVGGNGVSGQAFVDNRDFRKFTFKTFQARVLDMESAAVAHVAYANGVPFIAFRSLSDLAGGDQGENQLRTFFQLAADNTATVVRAFLRALPAVK
jgi:adenosylhomocysteine nucleosidase